MRPPKLEAGVRLGNYRIERLIGRGGEAQVFLATDVFLNRPAAVKVLRFRGEGTVVAEAQKLARLDHPNIVRVYHAEPLGDGAWYMAMEYLKGGSVRALVRHVKRLPPRGMIDVAMAVTKGLEHAHQLGIVHRDIKPRNLLFTTDGTVKITDFGLASLEGSPSNTGRLVGTPQYLAPELWHNEEATPFTDIYALGGCMLFMLTGRHPFPGEEISDQRRGHLTELPRVSRSIPEPLRVLIKQCLAKEPAVRPQSASELMHRLTQIFLELDREEDRRA